MSKPPFRDPRYGWMIGDCLIVITIGVVLLLAGLAGFWK